MSIKTKETKPISKSTEEMIREFVAAAPRLDPQHIESTIVDEQYARSTGTLTICVLTLRNGTTVTGQSACVSPENFDPDIGQKVAREDAFRKIWGLEGYLLKERLYQASLAVQDTPPDSPSI